MTSHFRFSAGHNKHDNTPEQQIVEDFEDFVEHIDTHRGEQKGQNYTCGPMAFGPHDNTNKYPENAHYRSAKHAEPSSFLPFDIDDMAGESVQLATLEYFQKWRGYMYETASSTSQNPRMRALFNQCLHAEVRT